jgi:hypothetical protein
LGVFGEKLRRQREQRGITLESICSVTKISMRMLRALEQENFDQLPGGVFNKGFVRAYARQVGLDEEEAIADYLLALRENQVQSQTVPSDSRISAAAHGHIASTPAHPDPGAPSPTTTIASVDDGTQIAGPQSDRAESLSDQHSSAPVFTTGTFGESQPTRVYRFPWGAVTAAAIIVALLAFWSVHRRGHFKALSPAAATQPPAAATAPQPPVSLPSPEGSARNSASSLSAGSLPNSPARDKTSPPSLDFSASRKPLASAQGVTPTQASPSHAAVTTQAAIEAGSPALKAARPASLRLIVRADKTSWVLIVADGKPVAEETLIAPAETSIHAGNQIVVKAGNAAGVSFFLNGKEIPAQGLDGEVRTYIFDSAGMKVSHSAPTSGTNVEVPENF